MDTTPLETQIHSWIIDGKTLAECLPLARKQFPRETVSHIEERWNHYHKYSALNPRRTAAEELNWIRCRRQYLMQKMEEKIAAEEDKLPVSLLSLYRGVLREQEKFCLEMLKQGEPLLSTPAPLVVQKPVATGRANHLVAGCLALFLFFAGYGLRFSTEPTPVTLACQAEATPPLSKGRPGGVALCNDLCSCTNHPLPQSTSAILNSQFCILNSNPASVGWIERQGIRCLCSSETKLAPPHADCVMANSREDSAIIDEGFANGWWGELDVARPPLHRNRDARPTLLLTQTYSHRPHSFSILNSTFSIPSTHPLPTPT